VDRVTRKELKTDKFALEVGHTVSLFEEHQKEVIRYGAIGLVAIALGLGYWIYRGREHRALEQQLAAAILAQEAPAGPGSSATGGLVFPSEEAKLKAVTKDFTEIQTQHPGTGEAAIAGYYLGASQADAGNLSQAEKTFQEVADHGDKQYASLANLSLAQIYFSTGRDAQGEKILRTLMDHPTMFVSKAQATMSLARYLAKKNPAEARKLLKALVPETGTVSEEALTLLGQIGTQ
jgi:predicted negative regulator of RcsB-dependent stress response